MNLSGQVILSSVVEINQTDQIFELKKLSQHNLFLKESGF
jgi:hypothetical protein